MKTYHGSWDGVAARVWWTDGRSEEDLDTAPSRALRDHSPDGFGWGYSGSGPAQLALAILLDATGNKDMALERYQAFKDAFVAGLSKPRWVIEQLAVLAWLHGLGDRPDCPACGGDGVVEGKCSECSGKSAAHRCAACSDCGTVVPALPDAMTGSLYPVPEIRGLESLWQL